MTNAESLELYERYLTDVKKASNNTLASYLRDVRQLGDYLEASTGETLDSAGEDELYDYIESLRAKGKSWCRIRRPRSCRRFSPARRLIFFWSSRSAWI